MKHINHTPVTVKQYLRDMLAKPEHNHQPASGALTKQSTITRFMAHTCNRIIMKGIVPTVAVKKISA